jgi:hypothetical protein
VGTRPGVGAARRRRGRAPVILGAVAIGVVVGVGFGAVTSMVNVFGSAYGQHALDPGQGVIALQFLSKTLDSLWAWALLPFVVGWAVRRPLVSAISGTLAVLAALVAYYASDAWLGVTNGMQLNEISLWAPYALVGAPVLGVVGSYARHGRWVPALAAGLVAPAVMAFCVTYRPSGSTPTGAWADAVVVCAAGLLCLALLVRFARQGRRTLAR